MTFIEENPTRMQMKQRAIRKRIYKYGSIDRSCPCDICGKNAATDMHEIINKDRVYEPNVRLLTEVPELCSLLCQNCHANKAAGMKEQLLKKNMEIYGKKAVVDALYAVSAKYRRGIEL